MYNIPKSIEGDLQRFIQIFVCGVSWLRLKIKEKNIDVKVKDQFDECKIEYINKAFITNKFSKYVYCC
jgi:hypothetical protein